VTQKRKHIVIIGGGASGFFAAINIAETNKDVKVTILEKSNKLLSKVRISGGGRCNVTHHCFDNSELIKNYPRGNKELKQVFSHFSVSDLIDWFKSRGVKLKIESDGRMFPESNSSETIVNCFLNEAQKYNVEVLINHEVTSVSMQNDSKFLIHTLNNDIVADYLVCSIGGHHQLKNYSFIQKLGHTIDTLIPSLFTINLPKHPITSLMGLSVKFATIKVIGTKHHFSGPLLITHWGLSGPAVLKLSAFAALDFFNKNYEADISVNWTGKKAEEEIRAEIVETSLKMKSLVINTYLFDFPKRLWEYFVSKADIQPHKPWNELSKKQINSLVQILFNDVYHMKGKTTFKDEFVTAGGVNLKEIDFKTMESKLVPGLFFCGEVINIDGITGGFNFQNAWSTAWIAANSLTKKLN
jgi:predicted Rossmann fold flavoprotein